MSLMAGSAKNQKIKGDEQPIVAIDIGTFYLRLIAGTVQKDGSVEVSYYAQRQAAGMVAGSISNLNALAHEIVNLITEYQQASGDSRGVFVLGVAGRHIQSTNSHGNTTIVGESVSAVDRRKAIENACAVRLGEGYRLLHAVPRDFTVNGQPGITDPVGLSAPRIDVSVHLISLSTDQDKNLRRVINMVSEQLKVRKIVYNGVAAADSVLTESEKEIGVGVIDLGEGTVNVAIYDRKQLIISFGLAHCADRIRREIAQTFGLSLDMAEELKRDTKACTARLSDEYRNGFYTIPPAVEEDGQDYAGQPQEVPAIELTRIVEENLADTFRSVRDRIEDIVNQDSELSSLNLGAGFVLTGGLAAVPGIEYVAARSLSTQANAVVTVRVGRPRGVTVTAEDDEDLKIKMQMPDKAVILGLLRHQGLELYEKISSDEAMAENKKTGFLHRVLSWWKSEF